MPKRCKADSIQGAGRAASPGESMGRVSVCWLCRGQGMPLVAPTTGDVQAEDERLA